LNIKLKDALAESADLKAAYDLDPVAKEVIDFAIAVEGLARSAGTHAAGIVIADVPLDTVLPLQTITGKEDIITQWDGPTVEKVGLLTELRAREFYEKPTAERKRKLAAAVKRQSKRLRGQQLPPKLY
jgi:hypothetical protein